MPNRIVITGHTSDALRAHINDRVMGAISSFDGQVTGINVTVSDEDGPKHGANDRRFHAVVSLRGGGEVVVDERGDDPYGVVTMGGDRIKKALTRKLEKKHDKHHGAAENQHHTGLNK